MVLTFAVSWQQCQSKVGNRKSKNKFFADGDERVQTFEALPLWPQKQLFPPRKAVSNISAFQAAALNFLNKFSSFEGAWLEGVKEREMFISVCKCPDHHHGLSQGGQGRKCTADHQPKLCFWSCQLKQHPSILRKIQNVNSHRPGQGSQHSGHQSCLNPSSCLGHLGLMPFALLCESKHGRSFRKSWD